MDYQLGASNDTVIIVFHPENQSVPVPFEVLDDSRLELWESFVLQVRPHDADVKKLEESALNSTAVVAINDNESEQCGR